MRRCPTPSHTHQFTLDEFHIFGCDGGVEFGAAHAPQGLLEADVVRITLYQGLDTPLVIALWRGRGREGEREGEEELNIHTATWPHTLRHCLYYSPGARRRGRDSK